MAAERSSGRPSGRPNSSGRGSSSGSGRPSGGGSSGGRSGSGSGGRSGGSSGGNWGRDQKRSESPGNPADRKRQNRDYVPDKPRAKAPSNKRRIPAPPVDRERMEFERVPGEPSPRQSRDSGPADHPDIDVTEVRFTGAQGDTVRKLQKRLIEAATAFEAERFSEALRLLQSIDKLAPDTVEVLELKGLSEYRLGKWGPAIKDLERFGELTQSSDQLPILADCYRAKRDWTKVEDLWLDLGESSPASELVEEGRIVYSGALADQGKVRDAIKVLETAPRAPRKPKVQHLRRWYALADLYERAGDVAKARRLFTEIGMLNPEFGDANARALSLK